MLTPTAIGKLQGTVLWSLARRLHRNVGPRLCARVHGMVNTVGPDRLPDDLVLKHTYDYHPIELDPRLLERSLRTGEWARPDPAGPTSRSARLGRWLRLGGGWKSAQQHVSRNVHGRFIAAGDWDLQYLPFEIRRTVRDLFVDGLAPEQTTEYQKLQAWVAAGDFGWTRGCRSVADIDRYFADMIELYDRIRTDGYRSQTELGEDAADEIRICIDRDGRPCVFGGGTHRLSIAQLLGLERVPVIVKRVHSQWVQRCRESYGTDSTHVAVARGLAALTADPEQEPARAERRPQP
jgi:hypothetical protein